MSISLFCILSIFYDENKRIKELITLYCSGTVPANLDDHVEDIRLYGNKLVGNLLFENNPVQLWRCEGSRAGEAENGRNCFANCDWCCEDDQRCPFNGTVSDDENSSAGAESSMDNTEIPNSQKDTPQLEQDDDGGVVFLIILIVAFLCLVSCGVFLFCKIKASKQGKKESNNQLQVPPQEGKTEDPIYGRVTPSSRSIESSTNTGNSECTIFCMVFFLSFSPNNLSLDSVISVKKETNSTYDVGNMTHVATDDQSLYGFGNIEQQ